MSKNKTYTFAMHGGAGARPGRDYSRVEAHLETLAAEAGQRLASGAAALDVVEFAVVEMERSGLYVAGRGSAPNTAGYVELDASIMDGATQRAGAVASLRDAVQPISVARGVMDGTSHVMLAGAGALSFAREQGFALVENPNDYYTLPAGVEPDDINERMHGTVGAVAVDASGSTAAATSTGGTFAKLEGRVGDTPIIGAGTWADPEIAVSCTGTGEFFIRTAAAVSAANRVRAGQALADALDSVLDDVARLGGDGGIIAVTAAGEKAMRYNSEGMKRASIGDNASLEVKTFE